VDTGNGNVDVNLGTTSGNGQGDWIAGDYPGTADPLFGSPSATYAVQQGAFIQAGSGNDTLIGTNGDDLIAAGTGFDYMDGGNGGDT
jgi:Ca2+-binding RTX toxin-like protein